MTRRQKQIVDAVKKGATLWRYSTQSSGWLIWLGNSELVRGATIEKLEEAGQLVEDEKNSFYRPTGGSDILYKLP